LHPGLDLADRSDRLLIRLSLGVPGGAVDIARHARGALTRAEYMALHSAGLGGSAAVLEADDARLLPLVGNDSVRVAVVRRAARLEEERRISLAVMSVPLPAYEGG